MGSAPFGGCNHIPILHSPIAYLHVSAQRDGLSVSSDPRDGPPWHRIISRDYSVRPLLANYKPSSVLAPGYNAGFDHQQCLNVVVQRHSQLTNSEASCLVPLKIEPP